MASAVLLRSLPLRRWGIERPEIAEHDEPAAANGGEARRKQGWGWSKPAYTEEMTNDQTGSRRDFLFGRAAIRAVRGASEERADTNEHSFVPLRDSETWLLEFTRQAMACRWQVLLNSDGPTSGPEAAVESLEYLETLEDRWSVYREHSLMSSVNRLASVQPIAVDEQLFELLETGLQLHAWTDGAFDMTSGPLTKAWGFFRREGIFPTPEDLQQALACVGSQFVQLEPQSRSVRYLRPGVEINLGGIGKGFALDLCVARMREWGVGDFLFHGGQSSVVARGRRTGTSHASEGWRVGLSHPIWPGVRLAEFLLKNEALGTSGTGRQYFYHRGKRYGHIFDPRSGLPTDSILSATVIAPTAIEADALATACHVMGPEKSIAFLESRPQYAGLLVLPGKTREQVDLLPIGLADDRWRVVEERTND